MASNAERPVCEYGDVIIRDFKLEGMVAADHKRVNVIMPSDSSGVVHAESITKIVRDHLDYRENSSARIDQARHEARLRPEIGREYLEMCAATEAYWSSPEPAPVLLLPCIALSADTVGLTEIESDTEGVLADLAGQRRNVLMAMLMVRSVTAQTGALLGGDFAADVPLTDLEEQHTALGEAIESAIRDLKNSIPNRQALDVVTSEINASVAGAKFIHGISPFDTTQIIELGQGNLNLARPTPSDISLAASIDRLAIPSNTNLRSLVILTASEAALQLAYNIDSTPPPNIAKISSAVKAINVLLPANPESSNTKEILEAMPGQFPMVERFASTCFSKKRGLFG